jgi:hypothetical protein
LFYIFCSAQKTPKTLAKINHLKTTPFCPIRAPALHGSKTPLHKPPQKPLETRAVSV